MWNEVSATGYWAGEIWNRHKSGVVYPEWLSISAIYNDHGKIVKLAAMLSDITEQKESEERIKNLAYFDVLTHLPNRRMFSDRLSVALANAHRHGHQLGVIFLDLDLFKEVNDSLGHSAGDELLKQVAKRLRESLREGDTAARMGGDEFTILLQQIESEAAATAIAKRMIELISEPFDIAGEALNITASIGISLYPCDGLDEDTLLHQADAAMYRVKSVGRNRYQIYSEE